MHNTICGANAVAALFAHRPADVLRLFYAESERGGVGSWCAELARSRRPYRMLPPDELERVAGTAHHGGVCAVARMRPLPLLDFAAPPQHRLLLVVDGVGNPHNLGAIARSAAFFGVEAMLLHEVGGAAMPSDAAYRTAEGGLEALSVHRTRNLGHALRALEPFYRTVAATLSPDATPLPALPRDRPVALVVGHEERGVSAEALATCRRQVRIAGRRVQSLNVAQAAAVLLHALTEQPA